MFDPPTNNPEAAAIFSTLVEHSPDMIVRLDRDLRYTYVNATLEQRTGLPVATWLGRTVAEVAALGALTFHNQSHQRLQQVFATGQGDVFQAIVTLSEGERTLDVRLIPEFGADGGVTGVCCVGRDITAQWQAEQALRAAEARSRALLAALPDIMMRIHRDGTCLEVKLPLAPATHLAQTGPRPGQKLQEALPPGAAEPILAVHQQALATGEMQIFEVSTLLAGELRHGESRVVPLNPDEVLVVIRDITARKQAETEMGRAAEFNAFRLGLADALRPLADPVEIQRTAMRVLGEHLQADRVLYAEITADEETALIADNYVNNVPKLVGRLRVRDFGQVSEQLRAGERLILADIANDTTLVAADRAAILALGVRSVMNLPLVKGGRWVANLSVHHMQPRAWRANDIAFLEETAERTWSAVERARAEAALRASEEKYRSLFTAMDEGYLLGEVLCDEQERMVDLLYLEANPAAIRMMGGDYTGKRRSAVYPDAEPAPTWYETWGRVARTGQSKRMELYIGATGAWFDLYVFKPERENPASRRVAAVFQEVTQRKAAEAQLAAQHQQVQSLYRQLATSQEDTYKLLARELHDQVGQNLTALGLSLTLLQTRFARRLLNEAQVLQGFDDAQGLVIQISTTVRELLNELRPPTFDELGLLSTLRWYSDTLVRRVHLPITVSGEEPAPKLAEPVALTLFRITQEALTNVIKHAQATRVELQLWADAQEVHLTIADNGQGFTPMPLADLEQQPHWGMLTMQERAAAVGGRLTIESWPQHGTLVQVDIPRAPIGQSVVRPPRD